ncbi:MULTISPECIES: hypothetical protein [unclassified Crossiella]|uniref:hypothetical protein n=1 Tax=unclassified Crossiella TaxID=2620835 RepID=UPI0020000967|nr:MULTISPECIES: hypothetical protein [unclassified Crossiella]MCK2238023.1 hypothetical protein [Crossiella sp. S99.2]MCK2255306.1 hypothetical protein [Crossiella sp. S99.1]
MNEPSASERYRAITGQVDEAVRRMQKVDAERAKELSEVVRQAKDRHEKAEQQLAETEKQLAESWREVGKLFYEERWFQMKPLPKPMLPADGLTMEQRTARIKAAQTALEDLLRKRSGLIRRRD